MLYPRRCILPSTKLKRRLVLQLIIRNRAKGISLTATGQQMVPKIQNLLDEYESLMRDGGDMRTQVSGVLRVGYYAPAAPAFMPQIIERILAQNVDVTVKFSECDNQSAQDGLISGAYDVIVCVANAMKPGITYETLLEVPAYALVAKSHPFATRPCISMQDFCDENIVLLDLPVVSEYYASQFGQAGIAPNIVATATSLEMVRSLVGRGVGCSLLHVAVANELTYAGDTVVAVPLDPEVEPFKIVLGHLAGNPRRLVQVFIEELRSYFLGEDVAKLRVRSTSSE
ncbi:HTH-type transcriptional regulator YtlI [Nymphon striatum]|nr:HTH-type transcriptional regulator YtlI [Nymphon striatum]